MGCKTLMNTKFNKNQKKITFGITITIPVLVFFLLLGTSAVLSAPLQALLPDLEQELVYESSLFNSLSITSNRLGLFSDSNLTQALSLRDSNLIYRSKPVSRSLTADDRKVAHILQGDYSGNVSTLEGESVNEGISIQTDLSVPSDDQIYSSGNIILPAGKTHAEVIFKKSYQTRPLVTLLNDESHVYFLGDITLEGFTLLSHESSEEIRTISWAARGTHVVTVMIAENEIPTNEIYIIDTHDKQKLKVNDNERTSLPFDVEPPHITIYGEDPAHIKLGGTYTDAGAYATDNVSDTIGVYVSLDGISIGGIEDIFIDTSIAGIHTVTYSAIDQMGNFSTASRKIIVGEVNN
jgi:hypothetical protein